jgi:hypothetical protein
MGGYSLPGSQCSPVEPPPRHHNLPHCIKYANIYVHMKQLGNYNRVSRSLDDDPVAGVCRITSRATRVDISANRLAHVLVECEDITYAESLPISRG